MVLCCVCVIAITGCNGHYLPETPNLYRTGDNPFADVPMSLRTTEVEILYATDRVPIVDDENTDVAYSAGRSASLAFGRCTVSMGKDLSWEDLVAATLDPRKSKSVPLKVTSVQELVRFPSSVTPPVKIDGRFVIDPAMLTELHERDAEVLSIISKRLAVSSKKEITVFVHGIKNSFEDPIFRMAQLWHMMGRSGVPIVYSWPANPDLGPLRGYTHDRESGEFTVFHLRNFLRLLSQCPELERLNILAHSRGTDVLMTALRELQLQSLARGTDLRDDIKLGQVILAAPDLDFGVALQRFLPDFVHLAPTRLTLYVSDHDKAIGIAEWLFSSIGRLGKMREESLPLNGRGAVQMGLIDVIDVKTSFRGAYGHTYFIDNPAVLSDLILLLRDKRLPGIEHGRPLKRGNGLFWNIYDGYPNAGEHASEDQPSNL